MKLDNKSVELLNCFIDNYKASAYKCAKYMNSEKKIKIAYKNVHKKLHNLKKLGFIMMANDDENTESVSPHGAIYYKISDFGIFFMYNRREITRNLNPAIIFKHNTFHIYRHILYPYVQLQTLEKLETKRSIVGILAYLQNSCLLIETLFDHISKQAYIINPVEKIGGFILTFNVLPQLVIDELNLNKQLYSSSKVKRQYTKGEIVSDILSDRDRKILRVSKESRILYFKISETKEKLEGYENNFMNNDPIIEIDIDPKHDSIESLRNSYIPITIKDLVKYYFDKDYKFSVLGNIIKLLVDLISVEYSKITYEDLQNNLAVKDLIQLKNDKIFPDAAYTIKAHIEKIYDGFTKLGTI